MPDRASLAIRHLVDVQLAAAKTELCVTVVFSELWFLSIPKSLRHVPLDDQLIHPKDLAVDLIASSNKSEVRFLLRKEVIQPQVPLRLPCYDFIPVTTHSVGHYFPCGLARRLRLQVTSMM